MTSEHPVFHIEINCGLGWRRADLNTHYFDQARAITACQAMGKPGQRINYRVKDNEGEIIHRITS